MAVPMSATTSALSHIERVLDEKRWPGCDIARSLIFGNVSINPFGLQASLFLKVIPSRSHVAPRKNSHFVGWLCDVYMVAVEGIYRRSSALPSLMPTLCLTRLVVASDRKAADA